MHNELGVSPGGLCPRPQAHTKANFESCHGLQGRPRIAVEDVRDGRSSDPRFFGNPFNAPVAVPFTPQVNHHGLDHPVLWRGHVQAVRPAGVQARGATGLRSHHAFTVAPGTSNTLLGVVVAAFGAQVGFASVLVRPQRQLQHPSALANVSVLGHDVPASHRRRTACPIPERTAKSLCELAQPRSI